MLAVFFDFVAVLIMSVYLGRDTHIIPNYDVSSSLSPMTLTIRDAALALEDFSDLMRYSCTTSSACLNTAEILADTVADVWDVNEKVQSYSAQLRTSIDM